VKAHYAALFGTSMLIATVGMAFGQSNSPVIPFQGQLAEQSGLPRFAQGTVTMIFRIYDAPTGGTPLWEESQPNVAVNSGRFSVLLGSRSPLSEVVFLNKTVYLGITIDDGKRKTVDIEMRPRQAVVPALFALRSAEASKLNGHDWSDILVGGSKDPSSAKIRGDKVDLETRFEDYDSKLSKSQKDLDNAKTTIGEQRAELEKVKAELEAIKASFETFKKKMNDDTNAMVIGSSAEIVAQTQHLTELRANCNGNDLACLAAVHRFCREKGFLGGIPQEWNFQTTAVLCVGKMQ
jgi:hypothetical protein